MHKSKGFRKFNSRLDSFEEDIELTDIFCRNMDKITHENPDVIFDGVNQYHPKLKRRNSSNHNRILVSSHLKHTLYVSVIKEIYEELMIYLGYVLDCGSLTMEEPNRLVGNTQGVKFMANEILSLNTKEEIYGRVMSEIFRNLESARDTLSLIREINKRLDLGVSNEIIDAAMPYLDSRHAFVHADGLADDMFKRKYPNVALEDNGKIKLDKKIMKKVFSSVLKLVNEVEKKMSEKRYFPEAQYR